MNQNILLDALKLIAKALNGINDTITEDIRNIALKAIADHNKQDGCISVEDRLPENRQKVLCYTGYRMMENSWEKHTDQDKEWFKRVFTHWQHLPTPPKQ